MTNIGIVPPQPGFLEAVRALCDETGTLLINDETHTLSAGPGGCTQAYGLHPDAVTIGKAIAGGIPIGAYGVTEELAGRILGDPDADLVDQGGIGGTLAGNALASAAARATLEHVLTDDAFAHMTELATRYTDGVQGVLDEFRVPWVIVRLGARAEYRFTPVVPRTGSESRAAHDARARRVPAPLHDQPRDLHDAVPQHGAHVPGDLRGGRRPPHGGVRRGGRGALRLGVEAEAEAVQRAQPQIAAAACGLRPLGGAARDLDERQAQRLRRERQRPRLARSGAR